METTQTITPEGLESFGSSEAVSNISDFLSLEELGITEPVGSPDGINLDEVERPTKEDTPDVILPLEQLGEGDGIDLGEQELPVSTSTSDYKSIVKDLISNGVWEPIGAFETEDGEVDFEDMNIDKDTFVALMKHNQEELKSKLTSSTVSIDGISDFTQKLISIEKHGGNVQQALQAYQTVKQPLESIDVTDVRGQRAICYLRLQQQGITGDEAQDLIETYERKGVLEDKAVVFKEQLDTAFNDWIAKQEEAAIEEDKAYKNSMKAYKSSLNEALKAVPEFNLSETHRKKLLDIATKEQQDGSFELDSLIDNHRRNPLDAAELVLFLTDKDTFIKNKSQALLDLERKTALKTINIIPKGKSGVELGSKTKTNSDDAMIFPLDKLK